MSQGTRTPPGPLSRAISARIRATIAERLEVKQGQVAKAAGISASQFSAILNDTKSFELEQLDRVCHALGLRLTDLVRDAEKATGSRHAEQDAVARRI